MLAAGIALLALVVPTTVPDLSPADGLGLEPAPVARPGSTPSAPAGTAPPWRMPAGFATVGVIAVGGAATVRRRRPEPTYILVHGDGGAAEDFDRLLFRMGVTEDQTISFDYRSAHPGESSTHASRHASTTEAAAALDRLVRRTAATDGVVYTIHHSRGGAVGVEMIAAMDEGRRPPIEGYRGAALLDPAIGRGRLGFLQRLGGFLGVLPDNGGFDPIRCTDGCRDIREHLGRASGVEVVAIRNPDALVTNFVDEPLGLRTYDLIDDGGPSALSRWWNPLWTFGRIWSAHGSVLEHRSVADCVRAESLEPGSCRWTGHRRPRPMWGRGGGVNHVR